MLTRQQKPASARGQRGRDLFVDFSGGITAPRALLVADHPEALETLALLLRAEGIKTLEITNPEQAEHAARLFRPHAVILDIHNAAHVCRSLRAATPDTKFLIAAAVEPGGAQGELAADTAGFDLCFTSPITPAEIAESIRNALDAALVPTMQ